MNNKLNSLEYLEYMQLARKDLTPSEQIRWSQLFKRANPDQRNFAENERKEFLDEIEMSYTTISSNALNFLVDCPQPSIQAAVNPSLPMTLREKVAKIREEEKKGSDMYDLDFCEEDTMDMTKLNHLSTRMSNAFYTKKEALRKAYGLVDDDMPNTAKDLIARITAGKYVVPEDRMNELAYSPLTFFTWRDPSIKRDEESFKVAAENLRKARTAAEDIIVVMSDEATRLKALQDFESTMIQ